MAELGLNFTCSSATGDGPGKERIPSSSASLVAAVTFWRRSGVGLTKLAVSQEGVGWCGLQGPAQVTFDFSRLVFPPSPTGKGVLYNSEIWQELAEFGQFPSRTGMWRKALHDHNLVFKGFPFAPSCTQGSREGPHSPCWAQSVPSRASMLQFFAVRGPLNANAS